MPAHTIKIDVAAIIKRAGGVTKYHERLTKLGHKVTPKMIEKWRERCSMPQFWQVETKKMFARMGELFEVADYMVRRS